MSYLLPGLGILAVTGSNSNESATTGTPLWLTICAFLAAPVIGAFAGLLAGRLTHQRDLEKLLLEQSNSLTNLAKSHDLAMEQMTGQVQQTYIFGQLQGSLEVIETLRKKVREASSYAGFVASVYGLLADPHPLHDDPVERARTTAELVKRLDAAIDSAKATRITAMKLSATGLPEIAHELGRIEAATIQGMEGLVRISFEMVRGDESGALGPLQKIAVEEHDSMSQGSIPKEELDAVVQRYAELGARVERLMEEIADRLREG